MNSYKWSFSKIRVERNKPQNLTSNDDYLFVNEFIRKFKRPYYRKVQNINLINGKLRKYNYIRVHNSHWRMSKYKLKHLIKFFMQDIYDLVDNILSQQSDYNYEKVVIEKASWVLDQKSWKYFHWFCDVSQRIELINDFLDDYPIIITDDLLNFEYVNSILESNKIPYIVANKDTNYFIKNLLLTSHVFDSGNFKKDLIKNVRKKYTSSYPEILNEAPTTKIWMSRQNSKFRKLTNFDEVRIILKKYNYQIINTEKLAFKDQIKIYTSSKVIGGLHGGGLTNMLFMKKGSFVFEVRRSKDTRNNCYFSLANSLDHKYYYMLADSETDDMFLSDCTLDCKDLEDTLIEIDKQIS